MKIPSPEHIDLNEFVHNPYNRALSPEMIEETKKHIQETGEVKPIIYVELDPHTLQEPFNEHKKPLKMVIDGHHRLEALKSLGHKTAPAIKATNGILTSDKTREVEVAKAIKEKSAGKATPFSQQILAEARRRGQGIPSGQPLAGLESVADTGAVTVKNMVKGIAIEYLNKFIRHEGGKWVVHSESGNRTMGSYGTRAEAVHRLQQVEYFKHKKMATVDVAALTKVMAKSWFGDKSQTSYRHPALERVRSAAVSRGGHYTDAEVDSVPRPSYLGSSKPSTDELRGHKTWHLNHPEYDYTIKSTINDIDKSWFSEPDRHAEAAKGHVTGLKGSVPKSAAHNHLKTALKLAAVGAIAAGGVVALTNPGVRAAMGKIAANLFHKLPASKTATSAFKATLAEGGSTISLTGEVPAARYIFSPYKEAEKIIPKAKLTPHHIDNYIQENKGLLTQPNHHLGTWHNKETGNVHLDVSIPHTNRLQALTEAKTHNQLAIYDRVAGADIPVNESAIGRAKFIDTIRARHEYNPHSWKPVLADEGFGLDALKEASEATKTGQTPKELSVLYNRTNGYFGVGDASREHSDVFVNLADQYGAKVQGDLDMQWARMTYHPKSGTAGKLNLWNWSTEAEQARGSSSRNYADTFESILRNKSFPDDMLFGVKEPFTNKSSEKPLGEWRKLYGKTSKSITVEEMQTIMKNAKEINPTPVSAQANTQASIKQVQDIDDQLVHLYNSIKELESLAENQQLLSDDEIQEIIQPLQDTIEGLLNTAKGGTIKESEDIPQNSDPSNRANDPQRQRKQPFGPKRQVGTAERELTEPATDFYDKSLKSSNLHKGFFGFGNRGWHGDPEGHAEAARERWEVSGKTGKPGEVKTGVHHAIKEVAIKTARHTGNRIARVAGEAIADVGLAAFGTVAGLLILSHLKGSPMPMLQAGKLGLTSLKNAVQNSFKMAEIASMKNEVKLARLKVWLAHPERKISLPKGKG